MPRTIAVIINARAGAVLDAGADTISAALREGLHDSDHLDIQVLAPKKFARAVERIAKIEHDTVVIGGGDGSVNAALQALAGTDKTLGILPFGTLNLLARDLGIPNRPQDAIAALARAETRAIDLATLNGEYFHSMSGAGFFSQMARAREELRSVPGKVLRMASAAFRALSRTGRLSITLQADGHRDRIDCYALLVTCNAFSGDGWQRQSLEKGLLEVHVAENESAFGRMATAANLMSGRWRDNPHIQNFTAKRLHVESARRRLWVSTDGELSREDVPLNYAIKPKALKVLSIPKNAADAVR